MPSVPAIDDGSGTVPAPGPLIQYLPGPAPHACVTIRLYRSRSLAPPDPEIDDRPGTIPLPVNRMSGQLRTPTRMNGDRKKQKKN